MRVSAARPIPLSEQDPLYRVQQRGDGWRLTPDTFAETASGGKWKPWPHLRFVARELAADILDGGARTIINMPPGVGKSELFSKWLYLWALDVFPWWRIIAASHGQELASRYGREVRNTANASSLIRFVLRADSTAAHRWNTTQDGGLFATGVGGGVTGWRGNLIGIDDPHPTWEEVQSPAHRRTVHEWMDGTINDRLEPGGSIVIVMHRWHEEDLTGYLAGKADSRWKVIRLPAIAEPGDPLGRKPGEPLAPERFSLGEWRQKMAEAGPIVAPAKFQQNPEGVASDRAYYNYLPARNLDSGVRLVEHLPLHLSMDFNANPGMHLEVGQWADELDEAWCRHEVFAPGLRLTDSPSGLPGALTQFTKLVDCTYGGADPETWTKQNSAGVPFPFPELHVFGDASGDSPNAATVDTYWSIVKAKLRAWMDAKEEPKRIRYRVPAGNGPVKRRVETFNQALFDPFGYVHYRVHPDCVRLVVDLRKVKTLPDGKIDKTGEDQLTHASDAEGYRLVMIRPWKDPGAKAGPGKVTTGRAAQGKPQTLRQRNTDAVVRPTGGVSFTRTRVR